MSEADRIASLYSFDILDTAPEAAFDRLTELAAQLFDAPIALVSLMDADRQWFKAKVGLEASETPREQAFCAHAIRQDAGSVMIVEDASRDPRFESNPMVTAEPRIRFYAGAVLTSSDGQNLGTLCVLDQRPRPKLTAAEHKRLQILANMVVDELELRRATRKAEARQRQLELAEHMAALGNWRLDLASGALDWSSEMYRIHGVRRGAFEPSLTTVLPLYAPGDAARIRKALAKAQGGQGAFAFDLTLTRPDGARREVTCKAVTERDERGQARALIGVFQDVTAARLAVRSLAASEARYRLLADNASDMILQSDLDGRIVYVSPSVTATLGWTPAELVGRPALDLVHPDDFARVRAAVAEQVESRGHAASAKVEYRTRAKDGREIWLEATPRLALDPKSGRMTGFTDVIRDVSDRKALEAALRAARAEAETATVIKSEFLANMTHELRTPLTSIVGFTGLMAAQPELGGQSRQYLERIETAGQALLNAVNEVLDFSRLEAGEVRFTPRRVAPQALCAATLDLLTPQANGKGLALRLESAARPDLAVSIDPDRVRQVLLNLAGNAVKFCTKGGVTLRLAHEPVRERLRFEVVDNGPGLTDEQRARLFRRFSQVDGADTRRADGTGLGLAIAKGLVEAMGGSIGVTSEPGVGSTFWFELPAPLAPAADAAADAPAADFAGLRVLVADDHAPNRELAKVYLQAAGADVSEARDGREAVAAAAAEPFDVILMDMRMPALDGPLAVAEIRRAGGLNDMTPILAFSANSEDELAGALAAQGFDGLVAKPVCAGSLVAEVARVTNVAIDAGARKAG